MFSKEQLLIRNESVEIPNLDLTVFIQAIGQQLHELYQGLLPWQVSQHLHVNSINGHEGDYIIIRYIIWENKHKHLLTQMSRSIT